MKFICLSPTSPAFAPPDPPQSAATVVARIEVGALIQPEVSDEFCRGPGESTAYDWVYLLQKCYQLFPVQAFLGYQLTQGKSGHSVVYVGDRHSRFIVQSFATPSAA